MGSGKWEMAIGGRLGGESSHLNGSIRREICSFAPSECMNKCMIEWKAHTQILAHTYSVCHTDTHTHTYGKAGA